MAKFTMKFLQADLLTSNFYSIARTKYTFTESYPFISVNFIPSTLSRYSFISIQWTAVIHGSFSTRFG